MKDFRIPAHFEFFLSGAQRGMPDTAFSAPREIGVPNKTGFIGVVEDPNCTKMRKSKSRVNLRKLDNGNIS